MKKVDFQGTGETETGMGASPSGNGAHVRPVPSAPPSIPGFVKVTAIIILALVLVFVVLHLTGHGFGDHMHMSGM